MYDIIGDVHGHADKLIELLVSLDYKKEGTSYVHPNGRKVIFTGDYIDRGPNSFGVYRLVRSMVERNQAIAIMGNHEYNAVCFYLPDKKHGGNLRKHYIKNYHQHAETLQSISQAAKTLQKNEEMLYKEMIEWFMTLPLWFENEQFRVIHACWGYDEIAYLKSRFGKNILPATADIWAESADINTELFRSLEVILKGREFPLPDGLYYHDKDGTKRENFRIRWWDNPKEKKLGELFVKKEDALEKHAETKYNGSVSEYEPYRKDDLLVFFGHYWLEVPLSDVPENICCVDYSVAKGGKLGAYRHMGEESLDLNHLKLI